MSPDRAYFIGVRAHEVRISTHDGVWVAWVPDDLRAGRFVLASFGHDGIFGACAWRAALDILSNPL